MSVDKNPRLFEVSPVDQKTAAHLLFGVAPGESLRDITRIMTGGSTSNYKLTTQRGAFFLLRVYPPDHDHSAVEMAAYAHAKALFLVPEIYMFDDSKMIVPYTYVLMQFISGVTFLEYVRSHQAIGNALPEAIGEALALLHRRVYGEMARLMPDLSIARPLGTVRRTIEMALQGIPGEHLPEGTKEKIFAMLSERKDLLERLDMENVLSHGDFNFSNIIIDGQETPWFIDFEYCFSAPRYYDIGKFFRTKDHFDVLGIRDSFIHGYSRSANTQLPADWWPLSKLMDLQALLTLMNREHLPKGWANEIDKEILRNLRIIQQTRGS